MHNFTDFARKTLKKVGGVNIGFCRHSRILALIPPEKAARTDWGHTLICALFPYYAGDDAGANISLYARGRDYHSVVGEALGEVCNTLKSEYAGARFEHFCDSGALPEVAAARLCGSAFTGRNGLAITEKYGSFVFIGFILTDLEIDVPDLDAGRCSDCGACVSACPTGVLAGGDLHESCLSALTQRAGELSEKETELIHNSPLIWGCDTCQRVCPYNEAPAITHIAAFRDKIPALELSDIDRLTRREFLAKYPDRAFTWKGPSPLVRNLKIKSSR